MYIDAYLNGQPSRYKLSSKQLDTLRQIQIQVVDTNNKLHDLSQYTKAEVRWLKADGHQVHNDCTIDTENNCIVVDLTQQMLCVAGNSHFEIILFKEDGYITTGTMTMRVYANVHDDMNIESSDEFNIETLNNIIVQFEEIVVKLDEADEDLARLDDIILQANESLEKIEQANESIDESIAKIESTTTQVEQSLVTLNGDIAQAEESLANIESMTTQTGELIDELEATVILANEELTGIKNITTQANETLGNINNINTQAGESLTNLNGSITQANGYLDALEADIAEVESMIGILEEDAEQAGEMIDRLDNSITQVDNINITSTETEDSFIVTITDKNGNTTQSSNLKNNTNLSDYYTKDQVDELVENVDVDLTGYATEQFVTDEIAKIDIPEVNLDGYATETYVNGYVKSYVDERLGEIENGTY